MRKPRPNTYNPAQVLHLIKPRPLWDSAQLSLVLRNHRARSEAAPTQADDSRDAPVQQVWSHRPLRRWRCLTRFQIGNRIS